MQQQMSVITLGVGDLARSRRFYVNGFGWTPVFQNAEIVFYQMNGFVLGTWLTAHSKRIRSVPAWRGRVPSRWRTTSPRATTCSRRSIVSCNAAAAC
jgi:catechol 2,3-dioxygenase-like lactoylglutathione lyase family enzyme